MEQPIFDGLYPQQLYNGENLTEEQMGYILFENKILGSPRLRQLRVRFSLSMFFFLSIDHSSFSGNQ